MTDWNKHSEVAYQGEPGAYSESAVFRIFGPTAKPKPCKNFSDVFRNVLTDATKYGVVPIENSIEGSVSQVYDLFLRYDLKVSAELALPIAHCLIANEESDLESIKVVLVSTYDTAGSVKMIKEQKLTNAGAIAAERAAEIYKMKILAKDIADNRNNHTRFFVLTKNDVPPTGQDKTSIIFSTKHVPGALYEALGELATRGINMTKIESRPTRQNLWEYNFYLDFDGHMDEKNCADALAGLKARSVFVKVLGSYPRGIESK
ncbi:MAG: prephenate dehydratase [Candidatus Thorarchaeota archaeon]|jgi:chorismate mutase/prephenate dehydratase